MSGDLIEFIIFAVLYIASIVATYYLENKFSKKYELLIKASDFLHIFTFLSFGWWLLDRFFSGSDSSFGWWLLAFFIGEIVAGCIKYLTHFICKKKWPISDDQFIATVKVNKSFDIATHIFMATICLIFDIAVIFCLFVRAFNGIGEYLAALAVLGISTYGTYDSMKKVIKSWKGRA